MTLSQEPTATRMLVITTDTLGPRMAGPAIRAWEIARALHQLGSVRLITTESSTLACDDFPVAFADDSSLKSHVAWAEVVIFSGGVLSMHPWISDADVVLVADVYDPFHLESLELSRSLEPEQRDQLVYEYGRAINAQLARADFLICASEKQRDLWLGQIGALGRLNPLNYERDKSFRRLIDVVPFGVSDSSPVQVRHAIKGQIPGISAEDKVIIWGGGIYNWFDPITLIHAMAELSDSRPDVKLFFLGMSHPNPNIPEMDIATATRQLSDDLGLSGSTVFFNEGWVEYEDRANYLLDADLGVSTHFDHVETAFSFRTRILDYLWAGLPIVTTDGDTFAPIIREHKLGTVVPPEDPKALAGAIVDLLNGSHYVEIAENVRLYGKLSTWDSMLKPLLEFCSSPAHAADFPCGSSRSHFLRSREVDLAEIATLNGKLNEITSENVNLAQHASELRQQNDAIRNSRIWRATKFLRSRESDS